MFTQINKKLAKSLTLAVILALMVVGLALADVVVSDVDELIGAQTFIDLGTVSPGQAVSTWTSFQLVCSGKQHVDKDDIVTVQVQSSTSPIGGSISAGIATIGPIPDSWPEDYNNCISPAPVLGDNANSTVLITAPSVSGTYDFKVTYNIAYSGGVIQSDVAGKISEVTFRLKVDDTPPVITPNVFGTIGNNNWYTSDVTVSWTVIDLESDVSSSSGCDETVITTDTSGTTLTCTATSAGGTSSESVTIKRDATPPTVALVGGPAEGADYYFGFVPAAPTCSESDALSGLDGVCSVTGYSGLVGDHTVTASATDLAGNTASVSATYTVLPWELYGFYQPVDMGDVWNVVKGGSTVPLKFEVFAGATELTDTAVVSSFVAAPVTCPETAVISDAIEITTTGVTSLRYDLVEGQFINNWQTLKKPGTCYVVTMTTQDGSSLAANFKLK